MNKKHESLEAVHTHTHTNDLRKESGITLVALVVTIVVLLILAGVTINLVVGQNGLINKAKEAAQKTEEAKENEEENLGIILNYIKKSSGVSASGITKDDIGKIVTNYKENEEWEIFYSDNENVYLIKKERDEMAELNSKMANYNGTKVDFSDLSIVKMKYPAVAKGWLYEIYDSNANVVKYESESNAFKATQWLLDSTIWERYKTDKADWAIGAPTLELLVASYEKYLGISIEIKVDKETGYGETINNGLINDTVYNHGYNYWLACPGGVGGMRHVLYTEGKVSSTGINNILYVRPIVCLNKSVILKETENETFIIK